MAAPLSPPVDFCSVLSESKRIIHAHSRHFLALSVVFILPLSFSVVVYPTIQQLLIQPSTKTTEVFLRLTPESHPFVPSKSLILAVSYAVFIFVFSLCAVGSVTYSVYHGFFGRPVKFIAAIKSVFPSFFRLLVTTVVAQAIVFVICAVFGVFAFLVAYVIQVMGYELEFTSIGFIVFCAVVMVILSLILVYVQVKWTLMCVIAVVESSWGFEPLRRSAGLIKGMRRVALSSLLFFGFLSSILVWCSSVAASGFGIDSDGWKSWVFVLLIVVISALLTLLLLYNSAANTVMYMYCKAVHGELAWEIAEEFAREYVSLPFDDGKIPHIVSVVYP